MFDLIFRCVRLLGNWDDLHRRSAVKSVAMVAWTAIGLPGPIKPPGIERCVPSFCKLACCPILSRTVSIQLRQQWSPEQIAGWPKRTYPGELQNQLSHETIYRSLFVQARRMVPRAH
jgi:hypothetical protein